MYLPFFGIYFSSRFKQTDDQFRRFVIAWKIYKNFLLSMIACSKSVSREDRKLKVSKCLETCAHQTEQSLAEKQTNPNRMIYDRIVGVGLLLLFVFFEEKKDDKKMIDSINKEIARYIYIYIGGCGSRSINIKRSVPADRRDMISNINQIPFLYIHARSRSLYFMCTYVNHPILFKWTGASSTLAKFSAIDELCCFGKHLLRKRNPILERARLSL